MQNDKAILSKSAIVRATVVAGTARRASNSTIANDH
jgi:hypothetical protein